MSPHAFEIDPHSLTLTFRDPELYDAAEQVASSFGIGDSSRVADRLLIRCADVDDLALLGQLVADRAKGAAERPPFAVRQTLPQQHRRFRRHQGNCF